MKLQVADRMKDYEEGIFQILNEKKEEVEKKGKKVYNLSVILDSIFVEILRFFNFSSCF